MNIIRNLKNKFFKSSEKRLKPENYAYQFDYELYERTKDSYEDYEEIQAFVYKDLDFFKITPKSLSPEEREKIRKNKMELSRVLDNMIRNKTTIEKELEKFEDFKKEVVKNLPPNPSRNPSPNSSPIPRHPSTPDSE